MSAYPQEQTCLASATMSAKCHEQTHALQKLSLSSAAILSLIIPSLAFG